MNNPLFNKDSCKNFMVDEMSIHRDDVGDVIEYNDCMCSQTPNRGCKSFKIKGP